MADVSLDDLIKKDKEKGKVSKIKHVPLTSPRNSKPNSTRDQSTKLLLMTESLKVANLIKINLLTSVLRRNFKDGEMSGLDETVDHPGNNVKNLNLRRKKATTKKKRRK